LRVRRDDHEASLDFRIGEAAENFYQIAENSHAEARAKRIREGILRGTNAARHGVGFKALRASALDARHRIRESSAQPCFAPSSSAHFCRSTRYWLDRPLLLYTMIFRNPNSALLGRR